MTEKIRIPIVLDVTLCRMVFGSRELEETGVLVTSGIIHPTTQRHILEDQHSYNTTMIS